MQAQFFFFFSAPVTKGCTCKWALELWWIVHVHDSMPVVSINNNKLNTLFLPIRVRVTHRRAICQNWNFVSLISCLYQFCVILVSCLMRGWEKVLRNQKASIFYSNTACMNFQRMLNKQQTASLLIFDCGTSSPWTQVRVHNALFEPLHGTK